MILPAKPSDAPRITAITKTSKAHWGYSKKQLQLWEEDLTISPEYLQNCMAYKLEINQEIIGYYSLRKTTKKSILLDNLFLLPKGIGKGYGKLLLEDAFKKSQALSIKKMVLFSDPHAASFYEKQGFKTIGLFPTSIPRRFLPLMVKML